MAKDKVNYNTELKVASDFLEEARKVAGQRGVTNKYSFGDRIIDEYMGGGWGGLMGMS